MKSLYESAENCYKIVIFADDIKTDKILWDIIKLIL
jgi:hypothetical protein